MDKQLRMIIDHNLRKAFPYGYGSSLTPTGTLDIFIGMNYRDPIPKGHCELHIDGSIKEANEVCKSNAFQSIVLKSRLEYLKEKIDKTITSSYHIGVYDSYIIGNTISVGFASVPSYKMSECIITIDGEVRAATNWCTSENFKKRIKALIKQR